MDLGEIYGLDSDNRSLFLTSHEIQHSAEYRYEYYFPHNCSVYLYKNRIGVGKQISEMYVFISILSGQENFFDKGRKKSARLAIADRHIAERVCRVGLPPVVPGVPLR